jgi:hypothetical protein
MEFAETMTDNVFDSGDLTLTTIKNSQNYNWEMQQDINHTPSAGMFIVLLRMPGTGCYRKIRNPRLKPQKEKPY